MKRTAVSLFSGIGGFDIAAEANGFKILCQVEIDEFRRNGLNEIWPEIPCYEDIKDFPAEKYRGATLVMGGPPCQPVSLAGKRRGKEDDRFLWEETLSVIEIIKPSWVLLENPIGLISMGFDGICSTLESQGYEVGAVNLPACVVNSPQRRARVWVVGHSQESEGRVLHERGQSGGADIDTERSSQSHLSDAESDDIQHDPEPCTGKKGAIRRGKFDGGRGLQAGTEPFNGDMADAQENGHERPRPARGWGNGFENNGAGGFWSSYLWTPCADGKLRRTPDFTEQLVDGISVELPCKLVKRLPRKILAALGDSIVPQVAFQIIKAIADGMCRATRNSTV